MVIFFIFGRTTVYFPFTVLPFFRYIFRTGLKYFLNIQDNPSEDWFAQNASPEIVKKVFDYLSEEDKSSVIEELINNLNS
ncbi:hypothetical protein [Sphaerospermopsis reniformis]|uniref:hypothetical protein n=1 Tax=Sphaerospermopsis reniformis TaxID=531300 RepID=UPI001F428642|nr:hypothetical protein [Sphaerospermopsis reniformis]